MQNVPKIVQARMRDVRPVMTLESQGHPDADLLTAFAERSLAESERAHVLDHLAQCGDCREVIALALPESDVIPVVSTAPERGGWLNWPAFRWGMVAAGILLVASAGVMEYRQRQRTSQGEALVSKVPSLNGTSAGAEKSAPPAEPVAVPVPGVRSDRVEKRKDLQKKVAVATPTSSSKARQQPGLPASSKVVEVQPDAGLAGALDSAPNAREEVFQNPAASQNPTVDTSDVVGKAKDPVPVAAAADPELVSPNVALQLTPSLVNATARWTISPYGVLQRSFDSGQSWEDVSVGAASAVGQARRDVSPVFHAVTAAGSEVWAGGNAATLYHSIDYGNQWARVLPSEAGGAVLTGDIRRIEFADPQHGQIVTSSGETWITADDGESWRRQ